MKYRHGYSLIEMLLVIGIVMILISLLLPAINSARGAARRSVCMNRLRGFGIALANYEGASRVLPPGQIASGDLRLQGRNPPCSNPFAGVSLHFQMLPFMEQASLHDAFNVDLSNHAVENETVSGQSLEQFLCPDDGSASLSTERLVPLPFAVGKSMAPTSFVGVFGDVISRVDPSFYQPGCNVPETSLRNASGAFRSWRTVRVADVSDGMSRTLFMFERLAGRVSQGTSFGWWTEGTFGRTLGVTMVPPNHSLHSPAIPVLFWGEASSHHPGGVNALFGDGSVQFIGEGIDSWPVFVTGAPSGAFFVNGTYQNVPPRGLWQRLATIDAGD
jgi:prepilin-type processing-associated H-X9-DG protein